MNDAPAISSSDLSRLHLSSHEPQIALSALARLRWLAVIGQIAATCVAIWGLKLQVPVGPISGVILFTAITNLGMAPGMRWGRPPGWMVEAVLVADVLALTALLYFTGGARNPFSVLYLVHVAMAVIAVGSGWTWVIVSLAAGCYGMLFAWYVPLEMRPLPEWVLGTGHWVALVLVSVLIAAFIGRIQRSLRLREAELADVRERAARNERLASLTTLAAGAAHELNTPLGTIAVVAKELEVSADTGRDRGGERAAADTATIREDARLIRREVDRCREILQRMRVDIADVGQSGTVDVRGLVEHLRSQLRPAEAGRLRVEGLEEIDTIAAPPRALEQALLVLLRNAFDASENGSEVTLSVATRDGSVRFEVADRGSGMTEEQLRRAGEPFFTTKEPGKGMGLGLFLVRLIAERCGARFTIESKLGQGTRAGLEVRGCPRLSDET